MLQIYSAMSVAENGESIFLNRTLSADNFELEKAEIEVDCYKTRPGTAYGVVGYAVPDKAYVQCQMEEPTEMASFAGAVESIEYKEKTCKIKMGKSCGFISIIVWADQAHKMDLKEGSMIGGMGPLEIREFKGRYYSTIKFPAVQLLELPMQAPAPKDAPATSKRRARTAYVPNEAGNFDKIPF